MNYFWILLCVSVPQSDRLVSASTARGNQVCMPRTPCNGLDMHNRMEIAVSEVYTSYTSLWHMIIRIAGYNDIVASHPTSIISPLRNLPYYYTRCTMTTLAWRPCIIRKSKGLSKQKCVCVERQHLTLTAAWWPRRTWAGSLGLLAFQMHTKLSLPPLASLVPSGDHFSPHTSSRWRRD